MQVSTASTPGIAWAALASTDRTTPLATGACTANAYPTPSAGYS